MRVFLRHVVDGSVLLLVYAILANFTVITILCGLFLSHAFGRFRLGGGFDHVSRLMFFLGGLMFSHQPSTRLHVTFSRRVKEVAICFCWALVNSVN